MTRRGEPGGWVRWWRAEDGRVSAFVVVLITGILALAGLSLDGGLALATKVRATGHAESAARAGAQELDLSAYRGTGALHLDPGAAAARARNYLAALGTTGAVRVDGDTVTVTVTDTYRTRLLGLVGVHTVPVRADGAARPLTEAP